MNASRQQKLAKARFWQRIKANPALLPDEMTDAEIARVAGAVDIQMALKKTDFREWFMDTDVNRAMLEVGASIAIQRLIEIVEMSGSDLIGKDAEARTSDQVRAADMLLRAAGYATSAGKDATTVKDVGGMNEAELDAFINSKVKRLRQAP
jgi:hypothetical protein